MKTFKRSVVLTALMEGFTIFMRYGMKMESTRDTASTIGKLTFGVRIHHGYVGLVMLIIFYIWLKEKPGIVQWIAPIGFALVFSDFIQHFLVLWPIEGSPQFHWVYPK